MYFTACIIPLLTFAFFLRADARELYKLQHPYCSVALVFIFLPRTSVTQMSVYPPLLYCRTHQILLGRNVACVGHMMELGWANQATPASWQHVTMSELMGSSELMSEVRLLTFRISSLLCSRTYSKYSLEYWVLTMFGPARRPGTISTSQCRFNLF